MVRWSHDRKIASLNRTFMELKSQCLERLLGVVGVLIRTFMELKYGKTYAALLYGMS